MYKGLGKKERKTKAGNLQLYFQEQHPLKKKIK